MRQLARDLQRANGKWAPIYTRDVEYSVSRRKNRRLLDGCSTIPTAAAAAAVVLVHCWHGMNVHRSRQADMHGRLALAPWLDVT